MQRFDDVVRGQLALTAWRHGREYNSHPASVMVANCLRNRFSRGWGSWLGIIENIPRHSGTVEQPTGVPDHFDKNFLKVLSEIDAIYENSSKDTSNGALYWADTTKVDRDWFIENVARNPEHHMVANLNSLVFWD